MPPIPIDKSDATPNPYKFHKTNNYVKINKTMNTIDDQVAAAS